MSQPAPLLPPRDRTAELDLLAHVYQEGSGRIHLVADRVRAEHFYDTLNAHCYAAAIALVDAGTSVTIGNAQAWLTDRQLLLFRDAAGHTVQERLVADIRFHCPDLRLPDAAQRILEKHALRCYLVQLARITARAYGDTGPLDDFFAETQEELHAVVREHQNGTSKTDVFSLYDVVKPLAIDVMENRTREYVTTGIPDLDADMGGYELEFVSVLGAPTNWGKTNMVVLTVDENDRAGKNVLIVTFEDAPLLYGKRLTLRRNQISAGRMRNNSLDPDEQSKVVNFAEEVRRTHQRPLILDARGKPIENVVSRVRRICQSMKVHLIVWDYAQKMKSRFHYANTRERINYCVGEASDITKEMGAAGLILSQLKRLEKGQTEPTLNDLKESGDLENGAENVFLGFLDKEGYPRIRHAKGKDSPKGYDYGLVWDRKCAAFWPGGRIDDH